MQQGQNPRATVIKNVGQEQYILEQVLKQIPPLEQITFDIVIELFQKCYQIRQEPQFVQAIFNKDQIYEEFVMWLFEPIRMAEIRMKNSSKLPKGQWKNKYPFVCMQIAKQNNSFYEKLYLKAYFDDNSLMLWFNFLKQSNSETLATSLGYLTEIMLPFIKYQFSDSTQICQKLSQSCDEDILTTSSKISRQQTTLQQQRKKMELQRKRTYLEQQISILKIFSDEFFNFIFDYIMHQAIFKFIHNLILVSLQQNDLKRSKKIFQAFLKRSLQLSITNQQDGSIDQQLLQQGPVMDLCNEYVLQVLKQIQENANTQKNYRVIFFVDSMIRVHIIDIFIDRIQTSFLMSKENNQQKMTSSMDFTSIVEEEQILEYYLKSLSYFIKIYSKMIKTNKTSEDIQRQSKYYGDEDKNDQEQLSGQQKVMKQFSVQIQQIFKKLPDLSMLVKKYQPRSLPFSSGQNIKPVSFCKFQFFQLIYNCLILSMEHPQDFIVDTQNLNIFSIIQRYLQQNRWNNLTHQILEKIACVLIKSNKKFFRTKQMSKNNMADQFLNSIIEAFTNKKYIFLNSLRFTTQGNLHALYNIAKGIISELKECHKLANLIHEFEYYKKFFVDDLQQYEKRILQIKYPADQQDLRKSQTLQENDQLKLWVDQLYVGQMIKKIELGTKWPVKQSRRKHGSFIQRSLSSMSNQHLPSTMTSSAAQKAKFHPPPSQQLLNTQDQAQDCTDRYFTSIDKKKLFSTMEPSRQHIKSQVDSGSNKKSHFQSNFLKNHVRKVQSKQAEPSPKKQGSGLFSFHFNKTTKDQSKNFSQQKQKQRNNNLIGLVSNKSQKQIQQQQNYSINVFSQEENNNLKKSTSIQIKDLSDNELKKIEQKLFNSGQTGSSK